MYSLRFEPFEYVEVSTETMTIILTDFTRLYMRRGCVMIRVYRSVDTPHARNVRQLYRCTHNVFMRIPGDITNSTLRL